MAISITSLFVISLTINVGVLASIVLPAFFHLILSRLLKGSRYLVLYNEATYENPAFFRRVYLDILFNGAAMITGTLLLCTSNIFTDPFFAFSQTLEVAFSVVMGWHLFKIFQTICDPDESAKHSKITSVLRIVAVALYSSTLIYKQSAILGTIGLTVEGHALFFKLDKLWRVLKVNQKSRFYFVSALSTCISALVLRAAYPLFTLIIITKLHWNQIILVDYLPLAIFFLCLVFYTAANVWFVKVAFDPFTNFSSSKKQKQNNPLYTINSAVPCYIRNDLWTGRGQSSVGNIKLCNSSTTIPSTNPTQSMFV